MAYNLTTSISVPNPSRLLVSDVREIRSTRNDPNTVIELQVELELRSAGGSDRQYGTYLLAVRNGRSSQLRIRTPYPAGMVLQDMLEVSEQTVAAPTGGVSTPTGLDTALAAYRSGSTTTGGGRKDNLLNDLRTTGVIDQSAGLAGTVS